MIIDTDRIVFQDFVVDRQAHFYRDLTIIQFLRIMVRRIHIHSHLQYSLDVVWEKESFRKL